MKFNKHTVTLSRQEYFELQAKALKLFFLEKYGDRHIECLDWSPQWEEIVKEIGVERANQILYKDK